VRADLVGAYGAAAGATPGLDGLARDGVLFARAYTQSPLCLPAHATLLTGTTPRRHGVRDDEGFRLDPSVPTLAEALRTAGYRTAAFVSSTGLDRRHGLDRGFDLYEDDLGPVGKVPGRVERSLAAPIADRVLAWLARAGTGPFFAWVHLDEARPPFAAGSEAARFPGDPVLAALASVDRQVARLLEGVRRAAPTALVVAVADHGLSLGEHGEDTHGRQVFSATTRVPLLIALPGRLSAGRRVEPVVRAMDVTPTVLELVGAPAPGALQGTSLVPWMDGRTGDGPGAAPLESEAARLRYGFSPVAGLRSGPYLLIRGPRRQLYDSDQDPAETDDAAGRLSGTADALEKALDAWAERPSVPADASREEDLLRRYQVALDLAVRERRQAILAFRELVEEAPGLRLARQHLSEALVAEGRLAEAEEVLRALVERGDATDRTYLNLGLALFRSQGPEAALGWLRKGRQALPESAPLAHRTGRLLLQMGRADDAAEELEHAVRLEPLWLDARLALGQALGEAGRSAEQERVHAELQALAPNSEEAATAAAGRAQRRP
jgi:choline-sulfatase